MTRRNRLIGVPLSPNPKHRGDTLPYCGLNGSISYILKTLHTYRHTYKDIMVGQLYITCSTDNIGSILYMRRRRKHYYSFNINWKCTRNTIIYKSFVSKSLCKLIGLLYISWNYFWMEIDSLSAGIRDWEIEKKNLKKKYITRALKYENDIFYFQFLKIN